MLDFSVEEGRLRIVAREEDGTVKPSQEAVVTSPDRYEFARRQREFTQQVAPRVTKADNFNNTAPRERGAPSSV